MSAKIHKAKPFLPWYKTAGNAPLCTFTRGDIDRHGNLYILTIHRSLNKKGERVEDITHVQHMGNVYGLARQVIPLLKHLTTHEMWWSRAVESGDIKHVRQMLVMYS